MLPHSLAANLKNALLLKVSWPIELTNVSERYYDGANHLCVEVSVEEIFDVEVIYLRTLHGPCVGNVARIAFRPSPVLNALFYKHNTKRTMK